MMLNLEMAGTTQERDFIPHWQLPAITHSTRNGIIRKRIENQTKSIILLLFETLMCPYAEFCVYFWSLHLRKVSVVKVQRRATKINKEVKQLPYKEILRSLGPFSLERRKQSMNKVCKICKVIIES